MSSQTLPFDTRPQSAVVGPWSRILVPSTSDLFFLSIIVWSFLAGVNGWLRLLMDASAGIHIRIGEHILATHHVPTQDLFSFTAPGQTWYAFEWLAEVLFGAAHLAWGLKGVVLLTGLVLATFLTVLFRSMLARGANCWIAVVLTLLTANATNIAFHSRPHIFTFLMLTIAAWMVDNDRRRHSRAIWLLIPITVVWTNLHGGFFILFPFLGILVVGTALERRFRDTVRYLALAGWCALASLVNPYGIGLHQHVLFAVSDDWTKTFVEEFKSPSFRSETLLAYMIVLFVALGVCGLLIARRKYTEILWIAFFAYCSLISVRHVPLFLLVATPILAMELSERWSALVANLPRKSTARILDDLGTHLAINARRTSVWLPIALLVLCFVNGLAWPADFPSDLLPTRMAAAHADLLTGTRLYTSDQWADYLIYKNFPRQQVFMDDRHQFYGARIGNDYLTLLNGGREWRTVLDRYGIQTVLCESNAPLASLLRERGEWHLVEEDKLAALFTRR